MVKTAVLSMILIAGMLFAPAFAHGQRLIIQAGPAYGGYYGYPYYGPYYYPYYNSYYPYSYSPYTYGGYPYGVLGVPGLSFGFSFGHGGYYNNHFYGGSNFYRGNVGHF